MALTLSLSLTTLSDGNNSAFCFTVPEGYGDVDRRVDGMYTMAGGKLPFRARLTLDESGRVTQVVGYKPLARRTLPHALQPKSGDTFTPFVEVVTPSAEGARWNAAKALTTPLIFAEGGLAAVSQPPLPGEYLAGLMVEDLDGSLTRTYAPLAIDG